MRGISPRSKSTAPAEEQIDEGVRGLLSRAVVFVGGQACRKGPALCVSLFWWADRRGAKAQRFVFYCVCLIRGVFMCGFMVFLCVFGVMFNVFYGVRYTFLVVYGVLSWFLVFLGVLWWFFVFDRVLWWLVVVDRVSLGFMVVDRGLSWFFLCLSWFMSILG